MTHNRESRRGHRRQYAARVAAQIIVLVAGMTASLGSSGTGLAVAAYSRTSASAVAPGNRMAVVLAAAREFGVPARLLLAISYNETRWERLGDSPGVDGGYGLMNLTARTFPAQDGRGDPARPAPRTITLAKTHYTLNEAARLLHVSAMTLKTNQRQNVRGAAALLARYARNLSGGTLPASLGGWYGAVAEFSGAMYSQPARSFADDVFRTLGKGASLTTTDRQVMDLPPTPGLHPDRAQLSTLGLKPAAVAASPAVDCPPAISCTFLPAAYAQDDPNEPSNYGTYDTAGRRSSMHDPAGQRNLMRVIALLITDNVRW